MTSRASRDPSLGERSADLLKVIAEALGVDAGVFRARASIATSSDAPDGYRTLLLHRIIAVFEALPTDEHRLHALRMLEALVDQDDVEAREAAARSQQHPQCVRG